MLAFDSDPLFRPEGLAKEGRRSLPTLTRFFNREYTEPLPVALL